MRAIETSLAALLLVGTLAGCTDSLHDVPWSESSRVPLPRPIPSSTVVPLFSGNGQDGALSLSAGSMVVNTCSTITSSDATGVFVPAAPGVSAGRLVLLHVTQEVFAISGDAGDVDAAAVPLGGTWQLSRVTSIDTGQLVLDPWPTVDYRTDAGITSQLCTVPEFTDVSVGSGAAIVAPALAGFPQPAGGIVAFLANGMVTLDGAVHADGLGFPGGIVSSGPSQADVLLFDTASNQGDAKGHGLDSRSGTLLGRGNYANAGGGGNGRNAGGGGGGSGGSGGFGGKQREGDGDEPGTAGMPGSRVTLPLPLRLVHGGGAGSGEADNNEGTSGGNGGGIVFLKVSSIAGTGRISADGLSALDAIKDGAGGGGAGGTIVVGAFDASTFTGSVSANGGNGGNAGEDSGEHFGPGGGGGGGRILLDGVLTSVPSVEGGTNGLVLAATTDQPWGATAGLVGTVEQR